MISAGEWGETQVRGHVQGEETMDVKPRIVLSFGDPPRSERTNYRGHRLCLQRARSQNPRYAPVRAGPLGKGPCLGRASSSLWEHIDASSIPRYPQPHHVAVRSV